jgi:hypothetical protein
MYAVLAALLICTTVSADTLTGGAYTIDGGPTAISSSTNQTGGTYSAATAATPAGGYVSGGTFASGGVSPVVGFSAPTTTATTTSGSGSGGIFVSTPVVIESIVTTPGTTESTVTVRFNTPVAAQIIYKVGDTTHVSEASQPSIVHTFTLKNLTSDTTYPFSFTAQAKDATPGISTLAGPTLSFGGFSLVTRTPSTVPSQTLRGVVHDDAGAPLSGVAIQIRSTSQSGTRHSITTDTQGIFATTLPEGDYTVLYQKDAYREAVAPLYQSDAASEQVVTMTRDTVVEMSAGKCAAIIPLSIITISIILLALLVLYFFMSSYAYLYSVVASLGAFLLVIYRFFPCEVQTYISRMLL